MTAARTYSRLAALNVSNAVLGVASSVTVAWLFGTARDVEIYLAAVGLHATLVSLAQTGQVSEVLLPMFHRLRESHGRDDAHRTYSALVNRFLLLLTLVVAAGWWLAGLLADWRVPGFAPVDIERTAAMFRGILPLIVLQVAAELLKTLANAERLFGAPEAIAAVARLISIGFTVALAGRLGAWALVVALWAGSVTELVGIFLALRRRSYVHRWTLVLPEGARGLRLHLKLASTLPYVGATQVFAFVMDAAVSHMTQGSFAVFKYATTIWSRTSGVVLRPLSIPFFTEFSEASARRSATAGQVVETALARVIAVAAVVTAAVLAGVSPVLMAIWSSERFPPEQITRLVWLLAGLYALLPISGMALILRKMTISLHLIKETYLALAAVQMLSAICVWLMLPALGLVGVFAVSALNALGAYVAIVLVLRASGNPLQVRYPSNRLWRWSASVVPGILVGLLTVRLAEGLDGRLDLPTRFIEAATGCIASASAIAITLGCSLALRIPESLQLWDRVRQAGERRN